MNRLIQINKALSVYPAKRKNLDKDTRMYPARYILISFKLLSDKGMIKLPWHNDLTLSL